MERLFGTLELRATDDELREFEGIANTSALDDHGTVIEPAGARFTLPIPLLWQHDQRTPVGEITHAELRGGKWWVKGTIRKVAEPGRVRDATDAAWHNVKYQLVRGLSIGFKPVKRAANRFIEWVWRELSLVTIPSNAETSILAVRSAYLAASGGVSVVPAPGVSGPANPNPRHGKMTIAEQIQQHENSRAAKVAQKQALIDKAAAEGRTLDESESESFDTLDTEIRSIDGHLTRLSSLKRDTESVAVPVVATNSATASQARSGVPVVTVRDNTEPGIGFARYAMCLIAAKGNPYEAREIAKERYGDNAGEIEQMLTRAAVAAGTTSHATWAAPLVQPTNLTNEFLELLRPATILGKLDGLRRVPFNIAMPTQTAGGTYSWVGEGSAKPVTAAAFNTVTLGWAKAVGIIVLSKELVKFSTPSAEMVVRDELRDGMAAYLDAQFVDPAVTAIANVRPASITNGVAGTAASGVTEAAARTDLRALLAGFVTGNFGLGGVALLMSEGVAFTLGTLVNAVGEPAFPGVGPTGGNILGMQVVTSNAVGNQIIAVHKPSVMFAEDGLEIDLSEQASVQMDDAPDNPTLATTVLVSLWQRNLVGLRAERFINWKLARAGAVRRIHTVAYA
jgi:HK97 family phage major capsid protein/HK97 family phage prohead protease